MTKHIYSAADLHLLMPTKLCKRQHGSKAALEQREGFRLYGLLLALHQR